MKTLQYLFTTLLLIMVCYTAHAQYCGNSGSPSGSTVCTPGTNMTVAGMSPRYDSLPCATQGVPYSQTIQIKLSTTVGPAIDGLDWVRIDSIQNLPCGLCWHTNRSTNQFNGGEQFCLTITGNTNDTVGQYKLNFTVTLRRFAGGFPFTQSGINGSYFGWKMYSRVQASTGSCVPVDTSIAGKTSTFGPAASTVVTASGPVAFCAGGSVVLTAADSTAGNYQWYRGNTLLTGETGRSYTATTTGGYSVYMIKACAGVRSASTTVNVTAYPNAQVTPAGPITLNCGGSLQQLTGASAAGNATYKWLLNNTPVAGQTTRLLTPRAQGDYSLVITVNGCADTSNVVSINIAGTPPSPSISASSLALCTGQMDTIRTDQGYVSYTWSGGVSTTATAIVGSPGTYSVTVDDGVCTGSASVNITTGTGSATPVISVQGSLHLCGSDSVILTSSSPTGNTWSNASTGQSLIVHSPGVYYVTVHGTCGNATSLPDTVTHDVLPVVSLQADTGACAGDTILLDAGPGGITYSWSNASLTRTTKVTTTSQYRVSVTNNGCTAVDSVHVSFDPIPAPSFTAAGGILTASPSGGAYTYQWLVNGAVIVSGTSQVYDAHPSGTANYSVIVTDGFCSATSVPQLVTISGISELNSDLHTEIYPNPARGEVTISYTLYRSGAVDIYIADIMGRGIKGLYTGTLTAGPHLMVTDLSALAKGVYYINLRTDEGTVVKKVIKQ